MPIRIDSRNSDFAAQFTAFLASKREASADVEAVVRAVIDDVRLRGDTAVIEATRKFDRFAVDAGGLRFTPAEIAGPRPGAIVSARITGRTARGLVAEALAEPVSIQDLVVTPVVGALVGEYIFSPLRERIRAKPGKLDWADKATLFITDPLGVLSAETDRLLGVKTTLRLQPIGQRMPALAAGVGDAPLGTRAYSRSTAPAWGLQFSADW